MANTNNYSAITSARLPTFLLHGWTAKETENKSGIGDVQKYISSLPPLYSEPIAKTTKTAEGKSKIEYVNPRTDDEAVKKGHLGLDLVDSTQSYFKTDIDADLDLSKFVVSMQWENLTRSPYANATLELRMPLQLAHFLCHGEPAHVEYTNLLTKKQRPFRHLHAGGWASIRIPVRQPNESWDSYADERTVFWGKVISLTMRANIASSGVFTCSIMITLGSFITPFTTGQTMKTPFRMGKVLEIDPTAMGSYDAKNNKILKTLIDHLNTLKSGSKTDSQIDMAQSLGELVRTLGHFEVPDSLVPRSKELNKCARLGDEIHMLGHHDQVISTIYSSNASSVNNIWARPEESVFQNAFMRRTQTMWGLIQSLYQPSTDLIELFPVLIPLPPSGRAIEAAGGEGVIDPPKTVEVTSANLAEINKKLKHHLDRDGKVNKPATNPFVVGQTVPYGFIADVQNRPLVNKLKAIPYLMYRYKPMPPNFPADAPSVNSQNRLSGGLRSTTMRGQTHHEEHFGSRLEGEDLPRFVEINRGHITAFDLTWNETSRINAVNLSLPYNKAGTGDLNLFGVECVPVFNQQDINRHGLRMFNMHTPFAGASWEETAAYHRTASSGIAERVYWLLGEGHCYGEGTITMVYSPTPDLLAGVWCMTEFSEEDHIKQGIPNPHSKPLTYYVTSVSHSVSMDSSTGKPSGSTTLRVERASFGNRIPKIDLNQVRLQTRPEKIKDPEKTTSRKSNRTGK